MNEKLCEAQSNIWARPFGEWQYKAFVHTLCKNAAQLKEDGIAINSIDRRNQKTSQLNFLKDVRLEISKCHGHFDLENLAYGGRSPDGDSVTHRQSWRGDVCGYLRTLWNGWTTSARMRTMSNARCADACLFDCSPTAEDRIEHYAHCLVVWQFLATPFPKGPGVNMDSKSIDTFFGVRQGMTDNQRLQSAKAIHAIGKVLMYRRRGTITCESDYVQALRMKWNKA